MILIAIAAILVLGIAFYQVVQGLYSAIIMAILSVLCAMAAFAYYEPLAATLYDRQPAHADAGVLILLFVVPLLVLRLAFDRLLGGNVVMGVWIDRIGGGAVGLVVGIVLVGVLMVAVQMLPLGPNPFGYSPYDDTLQRDQELAPFYPDQAVVGMVNAFSAGSLAGRPFSRVHDDLLLELFCARNQVEQTRRIEKKYVTDRVGRVDSKPDWLTVIGAYALRPDSFTPGVTQARLDDLPSSPLLDKKANRDSKLIVIRVEVDGQARNAKDNWWRLPATHFRLVAGDKQGRVKSHYPLAYLTGRTRTSSGKRRLGPPGPDRWRLQAAQADDNGVAKIGALAVQRKWVKDAKEGDPGDKLTIDWVYRIGSRETPEYVVFRRTAADRVRRIKEDAPARNEALDRLEKPEGKTN